MIEVQIFIMVILLPGILLLEEIHALVVPVPVALEQLRGIVLALELEEVLELREADIHLAAKGVAMISGIEAAAMTQRDVDEAPERIAGADHPARRMLEVH